MSFSQSSSVTTGDFLAGLLLPNEKAVAGSNSDRGLYYSTDGGRIWTQSNVATGNFLSISFSGSNGIAASWSGNGLYYSTDGGRIWTQSNVTSRDFFSVISRNFLKKGNKGEITI